MEQNRIQESNFTRIRKITNYQLHCFQYEKPWLHATIIELYIFLFMSTSFKKGELKILINR